MDVCKEAVSCHSTLWSLSIPVDNHSMLQYLKTANASSVYTGVGLTQWVVWRSYIPMFSILHLKQKRPFIHSHSGVHCFVSVSVDDLHSGLTNHMNVGYARTCAKATE